MDGWEEGIQRWRADYYRLLHCVKKNDAVLIIKLIISLHIAVCVWLSWKYFKAVLTILLIGFAFRDACPQELWHYQDEFYEPRNFSENCLHMNIFMPNVGIIEWTNRCLYLDLRFAFIELFLSVDCLLSSTKHDLCNEWFLLADRQ